MQPLLVLLLFNLASQTELLQTTVKELAEQPQKFNHKMVSVRSQVILARGPFILTEGDLRILLEEPASSGVEPKPRFKLTEDAAWTALNDALRLLPPGSITRKRGRVVAVIEGRFDSAVAFRNQSRRHGDGYGHSGLYDYRIVVQRVSKVELLPFE